MNITEALNTLAEVVKKTDASFAVINQGVFPDQKDREAFQERVYTQADELFAALREKKWTNGETLELCRLLFQQQVSRFLKETV